MSAMAAMKALFLLLAGSGCLLADIVIPGYKQIDCLCNPGDTLAKVAKRSTGSVRNYKKLLPIHPKTGKVIRITSVDGYKRLPLNTKVFAPEELPPVSTGFTVQGRSVIEFCQQFNAKELNACVREVVTINSLKTCRIESLTSPYFGVLYIPNHFLLAGQASPGKILPKDSAAYSAKPAAKRAAMPKALIPAFIMQTPP